MNNFWFLVLGLIWGTFTGLCLGTLLTLVANPKMLYQISSYFRNKRLAEKAVSEHNKIETDTLPGIQPETNNSKQADSANPETSEKKAKESLAAKKAKLDQLAGAENQTLDLFDQISAAQREYAEDYYKVHKRLPPEFEGF